MPSPHDDLEKALEATNASFHVRLISTFAPDLEWATADADARAWLQSSNPDFDQFPVRDDAGATVGVLIRSTDLGQGKVRDLMHPLSESLIVSADMPIADLIPQLKGQHFRMVLRGARIDGLVTQSDLLKLPVRMLLFGMLSHLELLLREFVHQRAPWPAWVELLSARRRSQIRSDLAQLRSARFEPNPLELSSFGDVLEVLTKCPKDGDDFTSGASIKRLRDDVAHAKTYITSPDDVSNFVDCFENIERWIARAAATLKTTNGHIS